MLDIECVVIGAGVIGLAVAAKLAQQGRDVLILERESNFGTATSARNSEVIHAGIYYRPGSLKAQLCVKGKHMLYRYCEERGLGHQRCGKLIVATSASQLEQLNNIRINAQANGVNDLEMLTAGQVRELEPEIESHSALYSPSTGIVDSHALMLSLLGDAQNNGAVLVSQTEAKRIRYDINARCHVVDVEQDSEMLSLRSRYLVNAAGHGACEIAATSEQLAEHFKPEPVYSKGNYFSLSGRNPFKRLVYPVPEPGGLGVHVTIDLAGKARFGPDVEPINNLSYGVDPARSEKFHSAIRSYWPSLPEHSLEPDYAGIRPRVMYRNKLYDDFLIHDVSHHGVDGLINLFSIESPGLTASLAIAQSVADRIADSSLDT